MGTGWGSKVPAQNRTQLYLRARQVSRRGRESQKRFKRRGASKMVRRRSSHIGTGVKCTRHFELLHRKGA